MRAFRRWLKAGPVDVGDAVLGAVACLREPLEDVGFRLAEKPFDGSGAPAYSLNLERSDASGIKDYVVITFDKWRRLRFQVIFGSKEAAPSHNWVKSGALVWKFGSELDKHKWWGTKWWNVNKSEALASAVDEVMPLFPQVLRFLATGEAGANVHVSEIASPRR